MLLLAEKRPQEKCQQAPRHNPAAKRPNLLLVASSASSLSLKREAECNRGLPGCARWLSVTGECLLGPPPVDSNPESKPEHPLNIPIQFLLDNAYQHYMEKYTSFVLIL